ncbi:hypothetical protein [Streptomyces sp. NPDC088757]|uniref:hypothetical protein n=1 Tax=Streptomyces sp. NPDC088757 TaxID=3365889 RepID=UPI00380DA4A7
MFKHRRVRVACVLLVGWVALTVVEWRVEQAPWRTAVVSGFLMACVVAGTWWFAEMTQGLSSRTRGKRRTVMPPADDRSGEGTGHVHPTGVPAGGVEGDTRH